MRLQAGEYRRYRDSIHEESSFHLYTFLYFPHFTFINSADFIQTEIRELPTFPDIESGVRLDDFKKMNLG